MSTSMKSWATPLATATFMILAVTGILMFFNIEAGYSKTVHEWLSWAMVAGIMFHITANWKAFTSYFSRQPALAIIGIGMLVTVLSVFLPAGRESNPRMNITKALGSSKLEAVAVIAGQNSENIIGKLEKKGITVESSTTTIHEIATKNGKKEMDVLGIIFN
jgi:hypothetical protein